MAEQGTACKQPAAEAGQRVRRPRRYGETATLAADRLSDVAANDPGGLHNAADVHLPGHGGGYGPGLGCKRFAAQRLFSSWLGMAG